MVEVVIAPSHLAGAMVTNVREDSVGKWLILDRKGHEGGFITALDDYFKTRFMTVEGLAKFREAIGACPEHADVLAALDGVNA